MHIVIHIYFHNVLKSFNIFIGSKKYYVDKAVIAKESNIFKNLSKNTSQLILDDVDSITLETFLTYCYSGYIPYESEESDVSVEALAIFVEKYNVTNLKDLMDRYLSMTLNGETAKNWIKWASKLKMKNTALRLGFCEKNLIFSDFLTWEILTQKEL